MDRQQELQQILVNILGSDNVYFQPPESKKLQYPCIIYDISTVKRKYADNRAYIDTVRYSVMLITRTPKSDLVKEILELPYCEHERHYEADSLTHDTFTLFY